MATATRNMAEILKMLSLVIGDKKVYDFSEEEMKFVEKIENTRFHGNNYILEEYQGQTESSYDLSMSYEDEIEIKNVFGISTPSQPLASEKDIQKRINHFFQTESVRYSDWDKEWFVLSEKGKKIFNKLHGITCGNLLGITKKEMESYCN